MPSITLNNVSKYICRSINLEILDKELLVLLGPNGAGKSTLLNIIAGLVEYEGSVFFNGKSVDKLPASKRRIGYLFQDLNLFPHLDVASNIAYSLRVQKQPQCETEARVKELLEMMKINHLSSRYPKHLSGGEKQRVALARALALAPDVLLMDEPLSGLDTQASKYLRTELKQLQKKLSITTIYVTHDLTEAEEMADRISVIDSGCIEQVGRPQEVFFYPKSKKVSDFIGAPNILDCSYCHSLGKGVVEVGCGGLPIIIPDGVNTVKRIALFPRDIYLSEARVPGPDVNRFKGIVTCINSIDETVRIRLRVGKTDLTAEMPHHIFDNMSLAVGKEVFLILRLSRIAAYEDKEEKKENV
jgi:ABC-type sugar transport system ATPase subunit